MEYSFFHDIHRVLLFTDNGILLAYSTDVSDEIIFRIIETVTKAGKAKRNACGAGLIAGSCVSIVRT